MSTKTVTSTRRFFYVQNKECFSLIPNREEKRTYNSRVEQDLSLNSQSRKCWQFFVVVPGCAKDSSLWDSRDNPLAWQQRTLLQGITSRPLWIIYSLTSFKYRRRNDEVRGKKHLKWEILLGKFKRSNQLTHHSDVFEMEGSILCGYKCYSVKIGSYFTHK